MSAPQGQEQAHIRVHSAKALLAVLLAVKPASNKQASCRLSRALSLQGGLDMLHRVSGGCCLQASVVTITKDGVAMRWEDESKSLQSSVFLNSEVGTVLVDRFLDVTLIRRGETLRTCRPPTSIDARRCFWSSRSHGSGAALGCTSRLSWTP